MQVKQFFNYKYLFFIFLISGVFFSLSIFTKVAFAAEAEPVGFTINYEDQTFPITKTVINSWKGNYRITKSSILKAQPVSLGGLIINYLGSQPTKRTTTSLTQYDPGQVYNFLETIAEKVDTAPQNPSLTISENRATSFIPPVTGLSTNLFQSTLDVLEALEHGAIKSELIVDTAEPDTKLSSLNSLGIKELISRGESSFKGSPNNRRHNIKIGVEKMSGIIVMPGDEFSFNKYLGPVEAYTGFLPELVIKATGTVPEFGGGLCQVSSTTFRAAMQAGLPITQRRNHAYAVQYYAPQGTDATIYPGVIDLKFTNDTGKAILIWPYFKDKDHLVFDFYGAKDGREVTLEKPVQYDRKSDGSMKAYWTRIVTKNGKEEKVTFNSVYRSPALYHKTETFVTPPSTTPPATTPPTDPPTTSPPVTPPTQNPT